jgi:glycosyltransferase involved in cell wall biosynthesis
VNDYPPLVTVLTPVYNGEKYLSECIESVLNQDYENWQHIIVNNCSSDSTLDIASRYAEIDSRIHVISNLKHVDIIENHNIAFSLVPKGSKYCKVVSADDWIYPECIKRMVQLAEENPSIAVVGCYAISSEEVHYAGLPPERSVFSGREICRLHLLGGPWVIGAPTSILYRSEIVRSEEPFFAGHRSSADTSACYRILQQHDFGFVHQVLSFIRIHDGSMSARQSGLRALAFDKMAAVAEYGPIFLSSGEFNRRFDELLNNYYYDVLASAFIKRLGKAFWSYHIERLEEIRVKFSRSRLLRAVIKRILDLLSNPKQTIEKILKRTKEPYYL